MQPYIALRLTMLPSVPSSYSNMWWAESLKESIALNQDFGLKVLNEQHLKLDVALSQGRYIPFPTFETEVAPGFYHVNVQGSAHMFAGFMHVVNEQEVFWWGTDATDRVYVGQVAHCDLLQDQDVGYKSEMINWLGAITYSDKFNLDRNIYDILKPF